MRLVGYVRVSSTGQAVDGYGLDVQEKSLRSWAKANGHRLIGIERDEGVSGATDATDREGLSAALLAVAEGRADGLLIPRLDRLARALTVQEAALAVAWRAGGKVFSTDSGEILRDDPDDPMRTALRQVVGVFAELDRRMTVKRMKDGRAAKASTGRKSVGAYAYGTTGAGKGKGRDAVPDKTEQVAVARIVTLRREGESFRRIAATLDAEGFKPRRAASWSAMAVSKIAYREMREDANKAMNADLIDHDSDEVVRGLLRVAEEDALNKALVRQLKEDDLPARLLEATRRSQASADRFFGIER